MECFILPATKIYYYVLFEEKIPTLQTRMVKMYVSLKLYLIDSLVDITKKKIRKEIKELGF